MKLSLCLALLGGVLLAQEFRGTFSGSVTDQRGAATSKAKITLTETCTSTQILVSSERDFRLTDVHGELVRQLIA